MRNKQGIADYKDLTTNRDDRPLITAVIGTRKHPDEKKGTSSIGLESDSP